MKKFGMLLTVMLLVGLVTTVGAQGVSYDLPWNTSYQIANLGTGEANIHVDYYDADGVKDDAMSQDYPNVPVGGSVTTLQATEDTLGSGMWSAVVSADQPIAAVVNQQTDAGDGSSKPPFSSYSGASEGAMEVVVPVVMYNWFGYYTEIMIQNVGTADATNVDIEFTPTTYGGCVAGQSYTIEDQSIAQYAGKLFTQVDESNLGTTLSGDCAAYTDRFLGSAKITADQPVVAVINQHVQGKLFTYNGFSAGGTDMLLPAYMRNYYGYYASLTIVNPNDSAATVDLTYQSDATFSSPADTTVTGTHEVPAGESIVIYDGAGADDTDLAAMYPQDATHRFFGSVQLSSDLPVVAMVNQEAVEASGAQAGTYNGMFASDGSGKISIPLVQSDFYGFYTSITIVTVDGGEAEVDITYTSDNQYSSVKNTSRTYNLKTSGGFLNRYEGASATADQSDILDDTAWEADGAGRFIGSAVIEVTDGSEIVAFVNSEQSVDGFDSMYTYNAFNLTD